MLPDHRQRPVTRDRGASLVEYGILVALIAAVIITTVVLLGDRLGNAFDRVVGGLLG